MTLFICCQKDDESPPQLQENHIVASQSKVTMSTIGVDEIPEIMNYLSTKSNSKGQFSILKTNENNRSSEPDLILGELQTEEILKVTDQNNKSNYTFSLTSIESNDPTVRSFFNLVIIESSKGFHSNIIEYRPTIEWSNNGSEDFTTFSGEILYYTIYGEYLAKITLSNGINLGVETRNPCPLDGDPGNPDGDGGNGGNDGNDGNTGDGNTSDGGNEEGDIEIEIDIYFICIPCSHDNHNPHSQPCGHPVCTAVVEINQKSFQDHLRTVCDEVPEECHHPNGDPCPCDPNGGCAETPPEDEPDTNPTIGVINPPSDPCAKISSTLEDNNVSDAISDLDGAHTEPNERGYGISKNPDTSDFTTEGVQGGRRSTPLPIGGDIVGAAHIHTGDGYPMFSGDDIANIFLLYFRNNNRNHPDNPVRPDDIFSYLETSVGSFFITLENPGALAALVGTNDLFKDLKKKLNRAYRKSDPNSQSDFVEAFLETINTILEEKDVSAIPIRMLRLNSDNSTLVELTLDENGDVEETPCN